MLGRFVGRLLANGYGRGRAATLPQFTLYAPAQALDALAPRVQRMVQRALVAHNLGKSAESALRLRGALKAAGGRPDLLVLLAAVEHEAGRETEGHALLAQARCAEPGIARRYVETGNDLLRRGHWGQALSCFVSATQLDSEEPAHPAVVGDLLMLQRRETEARDWYARSARIAPRSGYVLKTVIAGLRAVYDSTDQLIETRRCYERELAELEANPPRLERSDLDGALMPFYLPYLGMNDREPQERLARIYLKAVPELGYRAPHCAPGRARRAGPLRVGFASAYFRRHSVGQYYTGVVRRLLERSDLDVHIITFGGELDAELRCDAEARGRHFLLPKDNVEACRRAITDLELDALLYADVGMHPSSYFLAFARLAPLQICMAGHPETTGIPNVDAFLSSDLMELPEADAHYSERLIRLRALPAVFPRPAQPKEILGRASFGMPEDRPVYVCPMKLQKMHPDFDRAIAEILRRDQQAEIVLFQDQHSPAWDTRVRRRFASSFPDVQTRLKFLPWAEPREFFSILTHADAALDTFHFGGGATAFVALAAGCPFVTLPGTMMRARQLLGCYRKMELTDCIAIDFGDYVDKVLRLGHDRSWRDAVRTRIRARSAILYDNYEMADELAEWLLRTSGVGGILDVRAQIAP